MGEINYVLFLNHYRSRRSTTGKNSSSDEIHCCPAKACIKTVIKYRSHMVDQNCEGKRKRRERQKSLSSLRKVYKANNGYVEGQQVR